MNCPPLDPLVCPATGEVPGPSFLEDTRAKPRPRPALRDLSVTDMITYIN